MILAGACLLAVAPFSRLGIPSGHDFEFHLFSWMDVLNQWKHGTALPRWAAGSYWGYGEARFLFYPPASWMLGAALGVVLPWKLVPGAYCWIALTFAAMAMYRLARQWLPPSDALFAAVFYALNPYLLLVIYWRSAYAEMLAAALLPLLLLCLWRLDRPGILPTLGLSVTLAAAWLTNIPAAVMIHYSAVALALFLAASRRFQSPRPSRLLFRTALAIFVGACLASFYLLPAIYERSWVNISQVMSPGVRPQDNFLFTHLADPDHNRFNLLISIVTIAEILVLAGAVCGLTRARMLRAATLSTGAEHFPVGETPWILLSFWASGGVLLMFSITNLFWRNLPNLRFVQLPFRWLLCVNVALALLVAMAAKRWPWRLLASVFLLGVLLIAGKQIQLPWWDTAADLTDMNRAVMEGEGYDGTDEYVPAHADPSELNKNLPQVSDGAGNRVQSKILLWGPTEKRFTLHVVEAENLTVRLFNYPAWEVVVNGKPTATRTMEVTGLLVIPVPAGDDDVRIFFRRTIDRAIGGVVSLITFLVVLIVSLPAILLKPRKSEPHVADLSSPAA